MPRRSITSTKEEGGGLKCFSLRGSPVPGKAAFNSCSSGISHRLSEATGSTPPPLDSATPFPCMWKPGLRAANWPVSPPPQRCQLLRS